VIRSSVPLERSAAASAAAAGSTICRNTKRSATKSSTGADCKCQDNISGSSMFQSDFGRTRVPTFGRATIRAFAASTL